MVVLLSTVVMISMFKNPEYRKSPNPAKIMNRIDPYFFDMKCLKFVKHASYPFCLRKIRSWSTEPNLTIIDLINELKVLNF